MVALTVMLLCVFAVGCLYGLSRAIRYSRSLSNPNGPETWFKEATYPGPAELVDLYNTICYRHLADELEKSIEPSYRLCPVQGMIDPAASHIGGLPSLPDESFWPRSGDKPMALMAQIRLDQLPAPRSALLPDRGLLCFFCDPDQLAWEFSSSRKKWWEVLYIADPATTRPIPTPGEKLGLPYFTLVPAHVLARESAPDPAQLTSYEELSNVQRREVNEVYRQYVRANAPMHQILGHPVWRLEKTLERFNDIWQRTYPPQADAMLLLQIESSYTGGMVWNDCARLNFWISEEDLRNRRFEKTCVRVSL